MRSCLAVRTIRLWKNDPNRCRSGYQDFVGSHGTAVELRRRLIAAGLKSESAEQGTVEIYNSCTTDGNAHVALCRKLLAL